MRLPQDTSIISTYVAYLSGKSSRRSFTTPYVRTGIYPFLGFLHHGRSTASALASASA